MSVAMQNPPGADTNRYHGIAVVVPCYRVGRRVLDVLSRIGPEVCWIFVVDDGCPDRSGDLVEAECQDARVRVLRHERNLGVGAAMVTGYRAALETDAEVVVKLDGDGQMDPALLPRIAAPVRRGMADYVKGNRFFNPGDVEAMPKVRVVGNMALSFLAKLSTGYWQLFDPNNGYTAIHRSVLCLLPLDRLARGYFFESDLLYHLNQVRAAVHDLPMPAVYGDEPSSLRPWRMVLPFLAGHLRNFARRLIMSYFIRAFSLASMELVIGVLLFLFGAGFGTITWLRSITEGVPATAGTVMLAALPLITGLQLMLSWLNFDVATEPRRPISPELVD